MEHFADIQVAEKQEFDQFLTSKNIDPVAFCTAEPEKYSRWMILFSQVHPESFVLQQKFQINPIRRHYPATRYIP